MPLQSIKLQPGIDRSKTNYANEGGYFACDKVRFRYGSPQKIGGWVKYTVQTLVGTCRHLFNWVTLDNTNLLALGTNIKFYVESSGGLYDITPLRTTDTLGTNPFATTNGSKVVTVTHANHNAVSGDYVTFSSATATGGISAASLNTEFSLTVIDGNSYTITTGTAATSTTTGGGSSVSAAYQLSSTADKAVPGRGWNAGGWSRGTWDSPAATVTYSTLRQWSSESFGEDLVFCTRNGQLYYWRYADGLNHRAVALTDMTGASDVPLMATKVLLSTQDRHLIAFGTNPIGSTDQDPLLIRWADTESLTNWTPAITNASGDLRLSSGNHIVTAVRLKEEILVFTDGNIFSMQYIGAPDIFGIQPNSDNISIISANATAVASGAVFWMGTDKFYFYNGRAETLPCTLLDYIFNDINRTQADQIFAGTNEGFSEIWWFYCSAGSDTIDRYVIFNYDEKLWYYGTMNRSAWLDSPLKDYPLAANGGMIYLHENGVDDDRTGAINAWLESSDFDIGDGEEFMFVRRIIPDVTFDGSSAANPAINMVLTPRNSPGAPYKSSSSTSITRTATVPVDQFTEYKAVRLRGRQMRLRIESTDVGVQWSLGVPRIDIQSDGRK